MSRSQSELPGLAGAVPEGFHYRPELVTPQQEGELLAEFRQLPFREFEFRGFLGKRRVVSFGFRYDFNASRLLEAPDIPGFLLPLRSAAAAFAGIAADTLRQVLVTEYAPGAGIGWHRDRREFAEVIGISVGSPCRFILRREHAGRRERRVMVLEPRSAYLLRGEARTAWEHSIPAVPALRYSVTFRSMRTASER